MSKLHWKTTALMEQLSVNEEEPAQEPDEVSTMAQAMSYLPSELSAAYYESQRSTPGLIEEESPPAAFMERCGGDVFAAADMMAAYWSERKELMDKRAFQPLSTALHPDTLSLIESDFIAKLPADDGGSEVFLFDRARCCTSSRSWTRLRALVGEAILYWASKTSHSARTKGVVTLALVDVRERGLADRLNARPLLRLLETALPIGMKAIHVCLLTRHASLVNKTVIPVIRQQLRYCSNLPVYFHIGKEPMDLAPQLTAYGLEREKLPQALGGSWQLTPQATLTKPTLQAIMPLQRQLDPALDKPVESAASRKRIVDNSPSLSSANSGSMPQNQAINQEPLKRSAISRVTSPTDAFSDSKPAAMYAEDDLHRLAAAVRDVPPELSSAYMTAVREAPDIVQVESNPIKYLKYDKGDADKAALRLCDYWRLRVQAFGTRACLPLSISVEGALLPEDIDSMVSGYLSFPPYDDHGRSVITFQPDQMKDLSKESRLRLAFYYMHVICENEKSLTDGFVTIVIFGKSGMNADATSKKLVDELVGSCASHSAVVHVVNSPAGPDQKMFLEVMNPMVEHLLSCKTKKSQFVAHCGEKDELLWKLSSFGLEAQTLPEEVGGTWTFAQHKDWCRRRLHLETERYSLKRMPSPGWWNVHPAAATPSASSPSHTLDDSSESRAVKERLVEAIAEMTRTVDLMADDAKAAYMEAMERAPEVVKRDCDMEAFLRRENWNVTKAANRLIQYWKIRKKVFGKRAFLPLNQTAEGTLDRKDTAVLSSSYLISLPDDATGRSVIFCDGSRLERSTGESRLRCSFYMYSIAAENAKSQREGIVVIYVTTEPTFDRANVECLELVLSALPLVIRDVHLIFTDKQKPSLETDVPDVLDPKALSLFQHVAKNEVVRHYSNGESSLASGLEKYALSPDDLPKSLGGKYGFDRFSQWQELRLRYEWDLPAGAGNEENASAFDFTRVKGTYELTEEEKIERKRRLNVIHSRRKRERERIQIEVLNEQTGEQKEQRKRLEAETKRLEALYAQALGMIATCER